MPARNALQYECTNVCEHTISYRNSYENVKSDNAQLLFLTGLSVNTWSALWTFLKPFPENIISGKSAATEAEGRTNAPGAGSKATLSLEDHLFMTTMHIRLGRAEQDLAYQFGVSASCVSRTTVMWLKFLYLRLSLRPLWPKWEDVEATMPASFQETYPAIFGIIDATELRCKIPSKSALLSLQITHNFEGSICHCPKWCLYFRQWAIRWKC